MRANAFLSALPLAIGIGFAVGAPVNAHAQDTETFEMQVDTGRVMVMGGSLYYEEAGSGPVVVLSHGGFGDRRMWDPQFAALSSEFRVIRYDHRGFGRTRPPESGYSPVGDLRALLDALGVERAHFVGNSVSGSLAIDAALLIPERLASITVIASGPNGMKVDPAAYESVANVFRTAATAGVDSAVTLWLASPMIKVASTAPHTRDAVREMVLDNSGIFLMQQWPEEKLYPPAAQRLGSVTVPALVIIGTEDMPVVIQAAEFTAAGIPDATLVRIEGADHLPQLTHPVRVTKALRDFLRSHH